MNIHIKNVKNKQGSSQEENKQIIHEWVKWKFKTKTLGDVAKEVNRAIIAKNGKFIFSLPDKPVWNELQIFGKKCYIRAWRAKQNKNLAFMEVK